MQVRQRADKEDCAGHLEAHACVQYADLYHLPTQLQHSAVLLSYPKDRKVLYNHQGATQEFINNIIPIILMK